MERYWNIFENSLGINTYIYILVAKNGFTVFLSFLFVQFSIRFPPLEFPSHGCFHPVFIFPVKGLTCTKTDRFVCPKNTFLQNRSFRLREMITFKLNPDICHGWPQAGWPKGTTHFCEREKNVIPLRRNALQFLLRKKWRPSLARDLWVCAPSCCVFCSAGCPRHHLPTPAQVVLCWARPAAGTAPRSAELRKTLVSFTPNIHFSQTDRFVYAKWPLSELHPDLC